MKSRIEKSVSLQIIRIPKSEIKNIVFKDSEKEISFNGEMYDVKSKYLDGDYIVFKCVNDKKEKALLANLDKHVQRSIGTKSSSGQNQNNDISKNLVKDFFFTCISIHLPVAINYLIHHSSFIIYNSLFPSLSSPPPEVSFS